MDAAYNQKEYLIQVIEKAFAGVELEDGVSLHQTIEIDNYGHIDEVTRANIKSDERKDWKKLLDFPALGEIHGIGGLSFYDAKGLRFHLPAYMCLVVQHPEGEVADSLIFHLTQLSEYNRTRLAILDPYQRKAVAAFLHYIRHNGGNYFKWEHDTIEKALADYWSC